MATRQSETIAKLTGALIAAQREFDPALKTAENPHRKSKYVDLNHAWQACRAALWNHGLTVMQTTEVSSYRVAKTNKTGEITEAPELLLVTTLSHTSGEWIAGEYPLRPTVDDPQGLGAALTYARRYALMAMVGLAPEDDDGEAASRRSEGRGERGEERANGQRKPPVPDPPRDVPSWSDYAEKLLQQANTAWKQECEDHRVKPPKEWAQLCGIFQLAMHLGKVAISKGLPEPDVKDARWAHKIASKLWAKAPGKVRAECEAYLRAKALAAREACGLGPSGEDDDEVHGSALGDDGESAPAPVGERRELPEDGSDDDGWPEGRQ